MPRNITAKRVGRMMTNSIETEPRSPRRRLGRRPRLLDVSGLARDICLHRRDDDADDGYDGHRPQDVFCGDRAAFVAAQPGFCLMSDGHECGQETKHHDVSFHWGSFLGVVGRQVLPNIRSSEGATSRAMKMTPRSEPGMLMRSPTALASAISSLSMAARIAAERARRLV